MKANLSVCKFTYNRNRQKKGASDLLVLRSSSSEENENGCSKGRYRDAVVFFELKNRPPGPEQFCVFAQTTFKR